MMNNTLIAIIYLLIDIGISLFMFTNSMKRNSRLGVILSIINIWIPFIPFIIYMIMIRNDKYSNATNEMQ